jgi:uncharacterized protein
MEVSHVKLERLKMLLKEYGSAAVAFSGGVDSAFLLKVAHDVLAERCVAVTVRSCVFPLREFQAAAAFCEREGIRHLVVDGDVLGIDGFSDNLPDRCYLCKRKIFALMMDAALAEGVNAVCEGSNVDDTGDYRPGLRAVSELGMKSPLLICRLGKREIRNLSEELGLETFSKPSLACLASRFPYGERITRERLEMVERAEDFLRDAGFGQVRVRIHGDVARIETDQEGFAAVVGMRDRIDDALKGFGFSYVAVDLQGYRTGSMNKAVVSC